MEKLPVNQEGPEQLLSKAEIDQKIEELESRKSELTQQAIKLEIALNELVTAYTSAGIEAEHLHSMSIDLEERIDNPTLSEKMKERFSSLFGEEVWPENKADALQNKDNFKNRHLDLYAYTRSYGEAKESLKSHNIEEVMGAKSEAEEAMGEKLSFRGGVTEGEDLAPRFESMQKMGLKIEEIQAEVEKINLDLEQEREAAMEAYKREHPEPEVKKDEDEKSRLFEEFLQTKPDQSEIADIAINAVKYPETAFFRRVKQYLIENTWSGTVIYYAAAKAGGEFLSAYEDVVIEKVKDWGIEGLQLLIDRTTPSETPALYKELVQRIEAKFKEMIDNMIGREKAYPNLESFLASHFAGIENDKMKRLNYQTALANITGRPNLFPEVVLAEASAKESLKYLTDNPYLQLKDSYHTEGTPSDEIYYGHKVKVAESIHNVLERKYGKNWEHGLLLSALAEGQLESLPFKACLKLIELVNAEDELENMPRELYIVAQKVAMGYTTSIIDDYFPSHRDNHIKTEKELEEYLHKIVGKVYGKIDTDIRVKQDFVKETMLMKIRQAVEENKQELIASVRGREDKFKKLTE